MRRAQTLKEEGNRAFLAKQYAAAAACYTDSLGALGKCYYSACRSSCSLFFLSEPPSLFFLLPSNAILSSAQSCLVPIPLTPPETSGVDNEEPAIVLRCALLSNRAACSLPLKQFNACLEDCNEVLAFDAKKEKARYRRGLAYEGLGELDSALRDLKQVNHF
jgi:tetratricopeptide (TPR) repeat protein